MTRDTPAASFGNVLCAGALLFFASTCAGGAVVETFHADAPKGMARAVLHVVRPARNPVRAVLLAPGCNGNAKHWIQESAWARFAERNGALLAGISFASSESDILTGKGYYETELGSGDILFRLLQESGGGSLPLHVYGFSGGAHFAASLAERFPARVRSFCAFSAAWWPELNGREGVAHAVIACGNEDERLGASLAHFIRARRAGRPWLWLPLAGVAHARSGELERFVRAYWECLWDNDPQEGLWIDWMTGRQIESSARLADPGLYAWLPSEKLLMLWKRLQGS